MTHYSDPPSLDTLLSQMDEPDVPDNLADKIISAAIQLPQDTVVNSDANNAQSNSEHSNSQPITARQKGRKNSTQPNISKWHRIKNSRFIPNNYSSRAAMYIGGMVLLSSIAVGSFFNATPTEQANNSSIANNIQDTSTSVAEVNIPTPSIIAETSDTPSLNEISAPKTTVRQEIQSNNIVNNGLDKTAATTKADSQNTTGKPDIKTATLTGKPIANPSAKKNDATVNDDSIPSSGQSSDQPSGQSEIKTAKVPDSVKNDQLDDIPIIVRNSEPSSKSGTAIETNKVEPRFGITDNPLKKPNSPKSDDNLSAPNTNAPAKNPRLPFPNN